MDGWQCVDLAGAIGTPSSTAESYDTVGLVVPAPRPAQSRQQQRTTQYRVSKAPFFLVRSTGWQAMLKYSNRFCIPYDIPSHNYPYMQNRRLSTILRSYRRRPHRFNRMVIGFIIVGLVWYAI